SSPCCWPSPASASGTTPARPPARPPSPGPRAGRGRFPGAGSRGFSTPRRMDGCAAAPHGRRTGTRRPGGQFVSTPSTGPQSRDPRQSGARKDEGRPGFLASIKGPLVFSFALAVVGGAVAMFTASGGSDNPMRVDIGLIAFGVFFIVSLVVVA